MEESSIKYCTEFDPFDNLENYIKVLKKVQKGNIKKIGGKVKTPDKCKIKLKEHQKRIIFEMLVKEKQKYRVTEKINLFVISDKVGSGKSMNVLGLISHKPCVNDYVGNIIKHKPDNNFDFIGYEINKKSIFLKTNLIVIPHSIYHQWEEYINFFPNLTYYGIKKKKDITQLSWEKVIKGEYNILLVKSTKYNKLMDLLYEKYPLETYKKYLEKNCNYKTLYFENNNMNIKDLATKLLKGVLRKDNRINYKEKYNELIQLLLNIREVDINEIKDLWKEAIIDTTLNITGPIFDRVFFDEADSINIPNCRYAYGKYNWFITSSVNDLFFPKGTKNYTSYGKNIPKNVKGIHNQGFIRNIFSLNQSISNYRFIQDIYLKNNDKYIKESFDLEEPIRNYILCFTPICIKLLDKVGLPNIIDALNANDMTTAIGLVNGNIKTNKDISSLILSKFAEEIKRIENILHFKKNELLEIEIKIKNEKEILEKDKLVLQNYLLDKEILEETDEIIAVKGLDNSIINIGELNEKYKEIKENYEMQKKILEIQNNKKYSIKTSIKKKNGKLITEKNRHNSLKERITNVKEKNCPICLEKIDKPTIVPCCKNTYCFKCLMYCLNINDQCPLCRKTCKFDECTVIDNNYKDAKSNDNKVKLLKKIEKIIELVKDNEGNKRFLIFSSYENSFEKISDSLKKNNINFSMLKGSTGRIKNIIEDYKNNKINILLLNAKYFGSGLNLQMTSDIIIYHRMDKELEKQIIGRGQRLGRKGALRIYYLCHENEMVIKND